MVSSMKSPNTRKSSHINLYGEDMEILEQFRDYLRQSMGKVTKAQAVRIAILYAADAKGIDLSK